MNSSSVSDCLSDSSYYRVDVAVDLKREVESLVMTQGLFLEEGGAMEIDGDSLLRVRVDLPL